MGLGSVELSIEIGADVIHKQIPEFSPNPPEYVRVVGEGKIAIGSLGNRFRSVGFYYCSGIAIKDPFDKTYGFFHVRPGQELTEDDRNILTQLAGGTACVIQGSDSTEKRRLLRELSTDFGITHTDTISVNTATIYGKTLNFHAAFRPAANQVLVARISHGDVLTFPAFKSQ